MPEIRINFSELLYNGASRHFAKDMQEQLPSPEECYAWTENYRVAWAPHQSAILTAMMKALGVSFHRTVIDVSTAPFFMPQSDPLIINFRNEPEQFIDILTHELAHVLLTDNNVVRIRDVSPTKDLVVEWQKLFGTQHDFDTLVHIPVQALMKHVYLDVLKEPARLERDISESAQFHNSAAYVQSWQYVNNADYPQLLARLKASYASV